VVGQLTYTGNQALCQPAEFGQPTRRAFPSRDVSEPYTAPGLRLKPGNTGFDDVSDQIGRAPGFAGYCYLCGAPVKSGDVVCWAHSWAAK